MTDKILKAACILLFPIMWMICGLSSPPVQAAAPSDAEAIVRALDRISDRIDKRLDQINDTLKECRR